jgi:L-seryl-tRNA(Ser) seleniumtransferase
MADTRYRHVTNRAGEPHARTDAFGNPIAPGLPYARGAILTSTGDDLEKIRLAGQHLADHLDARGQEGVFNLSGLERRLPLTSEELPWCDDELAPAVYGDRIRKLGLDHLGGTTERDDVAVMNRLTAALVAATFVLVAPGQRVVGLSARYSHPVLPRATRRAGAEFRDCTALEEVEAELADDDAALLVITRLSVSYELVAEQEILAAIDLGHARGLPVMLDDAGGARVGPAAFGQRRLLEYPVQLGATGLDKYGVIGPRLGLLGGRRELVGKVRACAFELGLEARPMLYPAVVRTLSQYEPERVRELIASTKAVARELKRVLGEERVWETDVIVQLRGEDILGEALRRAGVDDPPIVPYEATAALSMILLRDHGVLTVHFAGIPPGTSALMLKFLPPETISRFGGPAAFARAVDTSLDTLAALVGNPRRVRSLLLDRKDDAE